MRVLFIGGTGNISTACSHLGLARGIELHLLTRNQRPVEIPGAKKITADISNPASVAHALNNQSGGGWDAVVNFIAYTPQDIERDLALFSGGGVGGAKTKQYIFISSAAVYQKPSAQPITESTPLHNPHWPYAQAKIAAEELLMQAYHEQNFPVTIVRPSHTYQTIIPAALGGGADYTLIDRMKRNLPFVVPGDGTSLWTLTHSEDFAKALVPLLAHPQSLGQAYHITSDEHLTWNQIYTTMAHTLGVEPKMVHIPTDLILQIDPTKRGTLLGDKSHSTLFDNAKIKRLVPDFQCTIPFHQGIARTLAWFEADPSRQKCDPAATTLQEKLLAAYNAATTCPH